MNSFADIFSTSSSGIQILPAIRSTCEHVTTFIRSSTWVTPLRGFEQHIYSAEERDAFEKQAGTLLAWRKNAETNVNLIFPMFLNGSKLQEQTKKAVTVQMQRKLSDPELQKKLIPEWGFGCRRMTPGEGYLEALQANNVEVIIGEIDRITDIGCVANGREHQLDVLICATGFDVSFRPRFPIIGLGGRNLQDLWAKEAYSYMGTGAPEQPNYLHFLGPNCPIGAGPLVGAIGSSLSALSLVFSTCLTKILEAQADYMLHWVDRWQTEKIHSFTPKADAILDFAKRTDFFMRDSIWASGCRSWYKSHTINGRVSALWPGSSLHFFEALAHPRHDDFDVRYKGNRFDWLGNGFSQTECDLTSDLAYYIRDLDDSPFLSKARIRETLTKSGTCHRESPDDMAGEGTEKEWKAWC